ncbi:hypothetical protein ACVBEG_02975 [Pseudomonas sp. GG8]
MSEEDRKLLEMAARAAGYDVSIAKGGGVWINDGSKVWPRWNALNDDGDALRLAVKLDISLRLDGDEFTGIAHWRRDGRANRVVGNYQAGNAAEARRLIVRAAAEIAKATA